MSDVFQDLFNRNHPEKGVQLRGKDIDGSFYIKVEDVVALLEINQVLPKARGLLKARCKK